MKNIALLFALSLAVTASNLWAASIPNPSFETDTFTVSPGYVSGNSPITGWTSNNDSRVGINPSGGSPFANNGTIPAGSRVAFIESDTNTVGGVSLTTTMSDLIIGTAYKVTFRVNARTGNTAKLHVDIDGANLLKTGITAVGGTNPYKYFAFDFTATATAQTLTLRNDAAGSNTVLVDDFSIAPSASSWSFEAWNDDATSGVDGAKLYTHAFNFGTTAGANINGINFTGVAGSNPSGSSFSTAGFGQILNGDVNNVTGGSQSLATDFLYNGAVQSITINGLLAGGEYIATIYSVGWENDTRAATFSVGTNRLTVNQDHFGNNNGIRVSYRFVATGSSITLTFVPLQANTFHTYGFSNQEFSAPSAPTIGLQPVSQTAATGEDVTFSVTAGGSAPLFYQWRKDTVDLPGETNPTLLLSAVTTNANGFYSVIVSNASSAVTSSNASLQVGLAMLNRSFEADSFTVPPGYVSGNFPITGWTASGTHGINPTSDGGSPFADNGTVPHGTQVAFMQADGSLRQLIDGFTIGHQYYVVYHENARSAGVPGIEVKIGNTTVVPAHTRAAGGYVKMISDVFIADATSLELAFIKSNPQGGDTTALIDNVLVFPMPPGTAPTFTTQPGPLTVRLGDTATFTAGAIGSLPLTYQWRKGVTPLPGETARTLVLANVAKSDEANYSVIISNSFGTIVSSNAFLTVQEPITDLFNTGVDNNRVALPNGASDPHYVLTVNADGAAPTNSTVQSGIPGAWLANTPISKWIGPRVNTVASAVGQYVYQVTFDLTNRDPSTVSIEGQWATDNFGLDVRVNGASTGNANNNQFASMTPFTINTSNASFGPGLNTLEFVVDNAPPAGFTGLKVEFLRSNARILPNVKPAITSHPASQTAIEGDTVTLEVTASGSDPLLYQWYKNGDPISGKTNRTFVLPSVVECDSGNYSVVVSNTAGHAPSDPAPVLVAFRHIAPRIVFGTGLNPDSTLAANGSVDAHYILESSADANFPGPDAIVVTDTQFPISTGSWLASGPNSKWIAPRADQNILAGNPGGNVAGPYTYRTFLDLTGIDLSRFRLAGQWGVDNAGVDILINGVSTGNTATGFGSLTPFVITSGFLPGTNSVDFVMSNDVSNPVGASNPTGLRVDLEGLIDLRARMAVTVTGPNLVAIHWGGSCHRLQSAPAATGPWTTIVGAANPFPVNAANPQTQFFRVAP